MLALLATVNAGLPISAQDKDVTAEYIKSANMTSNEGWALAATGGGWATQVGTNPKVAETYAGWGNLDLTDYSMKQDILLPAGQYRLSAYAFYRYGLTYDTNPSISNARLFAGETSTPVTTLGSISLGNYANDVNAASAAFSEGNYLNEITFKTEKEETVTIGFEGTHTLKQSWFIVGPFILETITPIGKVSFSIPNNAPVPANEVNGIEVMFNIAEEASNGLVSSEGVDSPDALTIEATAQLYEDGTLVKTETAANTYGESLTLFKSFKFKVGKTYEVSITGGNIIITNNGSSIYASDMDVKTTFKTVAGALKAGTYFIQNAESGRYLVGGNSWGTQASLHKHGIDFIVTLNNGKYNLDSRISNGGSLHFLGDNLFVDSDAFGWTITMQEDGTYTISNGSNYLADNAGSSVIATATDGTAANARWNFISIEDVLKMAEYTTSEAPLDMTGFIMDYGFGRNNTRNSSWLGDDPAYRFDENGVYSNAEFYNKTFNLYQEITGLPKGTYMVKVQGYYRDGFPDVAAARHESGAENLNAVLYAVGKTSASAPLKSIFDADLANMTTTGDYYETSLGRVPHNMAAANYAFAAGMYEGNSVTVSVGSDGKLTIGIKQETAGANENWTIFDNFELYYLGSTDTKFRDAGETTYQLSDATALTNGETVEVDNAKIANGVVVSFPDAVVEQTWKSGFRAYTIVKEEGGTVYRLETNADENNILNVAKGLFKANRTYEVTIEHIDYLDYTRFCDEDPKFLALGFDGCDPMPLWSTDSWSSDRGSFSVTIKTDETVVEDNASAAKQIVFVEGGEATGIEGINTETVSTEYFNLNGVRVAAPQKGLNIIKKRMTDGSVKTLKVMVK